MIKLDKYFLLRVCEQLENANTIDSKILIGQIKDAITESDTKKMVKPQNSSLNQSLRECYPFKTIEEIKQISHSA